METAVIKQETSVPAKAKRRGRPKGSKNKKSVKASSGKTAKSAKSQAKTGAPRGRPRKSHASIPKQSSAAHRSTGNAGNEIESMIRGVLDLNGPTSMKMELIRTLIAKA